MSRNYMEQVAQMLGVEMGEKFHIDYYEDSIFYITENGLFSDVAGDDINVPNVLTNLLNGKRKICKIPKRKHTGLEDVKEGDTVFELSGESFLAPTIGLLAPWEFTDQDIRGNWIRYIAIKKRLARAASELNIEPIDWNNCEQQKWFIYYSGYSKNLDFMAPYTFISDGIYFTSKEAAQKAVEIVGKDDLIWMLRDFQPYLGYLAEVTESE